MTEELSDPRPGPTGPRDIAPGDGEADDGASPERHEYKDGPDGDRSVGDDTEGQITIV